MKISDSRFAEQIWKQLKTEVEKRFREREELEKKKARAFEAKLETDLVRHLLEEEKRA